MAGSPKERNQLWLILNGTDSEVCVNHPGFNEDLVVTAQPEAFAEWHLGHITWSEAHKTDRIKVSGPPALAKALPSWSKQSRWAHLDIGTRHRPVARP